MKIDKNFTFYRPIYLYTVLQTKHRVCRYEMTAVYSSASQRKAWIASCAGRYDPLLVKRSSDQ